MKRILLLILFLLLSSPADATDWTADANCMGAWLMEVDEDPLTDSSGEGNTAALDSANNPDYLTADPPDSGDNFNGTSIGYYDFSGDFATMNASMMESKSAITTVSWIYLDTQSNEDALIGKDNSYRVYLPDSGRELATYIKASNNDYSIYRANDDNYFTTGSWQHAATTWASPHTHVFYKNGVAAVSIVAIYVVGNPASNADNASSFMFGEDNQLDGKMDETAMFDTVLDGTDINDIMDNGLVQAAAGNPVASNTWLRGVVAQGVVIQ